MSSINNTTDKTKPLMLGSVPLHKLKIQAVTEGRSMRDIVESLIQKYLEEKSHVA
jgi:hypothetical protein